jgi:hypothetical protein
MKKGSLIPLVFIVSLFLIVPAAFWVLTSKTSNENVRGVSIKSDKKGILVRIDSNYGNWDMVKYLCKDKEVCEASLVSGKGLDTTSGGQVKNRDVVVEYSPDWKDYKYLKVYVRSGWGSQVREFKVTKIGSVPGMTTEKITYGGSDYNVVFIPLDTVSESLLPTVRFSDL